MPDSSDHGPHHPQTASESSYDKLGLTLRPAIPKDAHGIKQLTQLAFDKYIPQIGGTPRTIRRDYRQVIHQDQVWVVEENETLVAVLVLASCDHHFHISNLAVHPTWQRRGLGKGLLHHAEQQSQRAGYSEIWLHTNEIMVGNIRLYTSLGYEEMYRQTYHATASIYMRKILHL
ncbi:GNAT family N-acetyltransferase [Leptolyngbya cf. ectocarpi LEGE 11479]|uniref:GNAT family N-acetyltransferase n=1 Tax=Leptolyngbya cf. ectocarpi LEGE 11479 TaxID=1828722 RepID=A0A928ZSG6_LEPEC|nr:GNAT family N-acetyltransferase [Leptolyngbya ectocarpi]MBE9066207.1 GNAT family N-acetyltransferase [Leptolyngbya cf. ectocarpi LEGE 11479]